MNKCESFIRRYNSLFIDFTSKMVGNNKDYLYLDEQ